MDLQNAAQPTHQTSDQLAALTGCFANDDGMSREAARMKLVEIGGQDVIRALLIELNDPRRNVRWESAKALIELADPVAAPALVHHLQDEDGDIRWLSAEGLVALGFPGLLATLNSSIRNAGDVEFCKAAHHAFVGFKKHGVRAKYLDPVIHACEHEHGVSLPVAAYRALEQIKVES